MAETTGLLDQSLGPILTTWESLPIYGKIGVAVGAGALALGFYWLDNRDEEDTLDATDRAENLENLFKAPVEKVGRTANIKLYNQSDAAGKRCIGAIKKLDSNETKIADEKLLDVLEDKDKFEELKEDGLADVEGVTYAVVLGRKKLDRIINTFVYKLAGIFSSGSNPQAEYFDLPLKQLKITDQGVVVKQKYKLFKEDGMWQTATPESQERINQLTFMTTHSNWTESLQKLPEFYADLNMKVSGQKNIMNQKSENMREYKKSERMNDKMEAMED